MAVDILANCEGLPGQTLFCMLLLDSIFKGKKYNGKTQVVLKLIFLVYFQAIPHRTPHQSYTKNNEPQIPKAASGCLTCLSLTRRGPNTMHWMSLATNIRKQQAVFTSTWKEIKQSATNTFALFKNRERKQKNASNKTYHCSQTSFSCLFFFW